MKYIISIAALKISDNKEDELITYALGSCLGITVYDPIACVGGLLHVMLPISKINEKKAKENPCMFVDTGVPKLFLDSYKLGAKKSRLIVKVAGGACMQENEDDDCLQIGKRNFIMLRKLLWKNNVLIKSFDVGGNKSRIMSLDMKTGDVKIKINRKTIKL